MLFSSDEQKWMRRDQESIVVNDISSRVLILTVVLILNTDKITEGRTNRFGRSSPFS